MLETHGLQNLFLERLDVAVVGLDSHLVAVVMPLVVDDVVLLVLVNRIVSQRMAHILCFVGFGDD